MKRRGAQIDDLNVDVMKDIMISVAKSEEGAANFARTISVCKAFSDFANETEVLKAVVFEKERISEYDGSFWQVDGLLSKCARAGNMAACNILLKYLKERMGTSKEIVTAIDELKKEFQERMVAVRTVYLLGEE